jgi:hypothetical protein
MAVRHDQGAASIETDFWRTGHQRIVAKSRITACVEHDKGLVLPDSVIAEGDVAASFRHVQADAGFEPLPVRVDEGYEGDRDVERQSRKARQAVENFLRRRVENLEASERCDPSLLIDNSHHASQRIFEKYGKIISVELIPC